MTPKRIYFWNQSPPHVELGAYDIAAQLFVGGATYISFSQLRNERREIGWSARALGQQMSVSPASASSTISDILRSHPSAVHLFGGLTGNVGAALRQYLASGGKNAIVVTERPGVYGSFSQRLRRRAGLRLKHRLIRQRVQSGVRLLMPLGQRGMEAYRALGWEESKMLPFMYCPKSNGASDCQTQDNPFTDIVRFVYVGRLNKTTKGVDLMMSAFDQLSADNRWSLDIYGGHGDLEPSVRQWAATLDNVRWHGPILSSQVDKVLRSHDVCVVPSRFDGWNVVINEALAAGRGVITTPESVSHELIQESNAGLVTRGCEPSDLANSLRTVLEDPALVNSWHRSAVRYAPSISEVAIGHYLFDCVRYAIGESNRPLTPWLSHHDDVVS